MRVNVKTNLDTNVDYIKEEKKKGIDLTKKKCFANCKTLLIINLISNYGFISKAVISSNPKAPVPEACFIIEQSNL